MNTLPADGSVSHRFHPPPRTAKSPPPGQGRFIKIADPSVCPTRGGLFFEGRLVIRTRRQATRHTLASYGRGLNARPGGGDFPVSCI